MDVKCHILSAFLIRVIVVIYGHFQDFYFEVKYTDVDYHVFTDAARYVLNGSSPFERHTYRYTPLLAFVLLPNILIGPVFGKLLFSVLDVATGFLIYKIQNKYAFSAVICKRSCCMWLYNPLAIIISTRGNAEAVMTSLIMLTIFLNQLKYPMLSGVVYGLAVHFKIYPCIYALSFYFALSSSTHCNSRVGRFKALVYPNRQKFAFVFGSWIGFGIPTLVAFSLYKEEYIQEALLYHVIRKDIRHNFSFYFYSLYLLETLDFLLPVVSCASFSLQAILILLVPSVFSSLRTMPICLFLQTFIFVTFNKVCTSQYFLWYLCLFPLNYPLLNAKTKYILIAFLAWLLGQALWLLPAYYLEFQGQNTFIILSLASLLFFIINTYLLGMFIKCISNSLTTSGAKYK